MRWPFVSRERFEEMRAERNALQSKYDSLLERLIGKPYEPTETVSPDLPPLAPLLPMRHGRPTLEYITAEANKAAATAAKSPGVAFIRDFREKLLKFEKPA